MAGLVNPVDFSPTDVAVYLSKIVDLPTPPQEYIDYVGGGPAQGFIQTGASVFSNLLYYGMLRGDNITIVDLGCGCGRVALALGPHLRVGDRYIGFDTWPQGLSWAEKNLTSRYPGLTFRSLPEIGQSTRGGYRADNFFPIEVDDQSVDSVIALSLFTHLRLPAVVGYLTEVFRILKPGGRAYTTFVLCDAQNLVLINSKFTEQMRMVISLSRTLMWMPFCLNSGNTEHEALGFGSSSKIWDVGRSRETRFPGRDRIC